MNVIVLISKNTQDFLIKAAIETNNESFHDAQILHAPDETAFGTPYA